GRDPGRLQLVPDRRQDRLRVRVRDAVRGRGVRVEAVGIGGPEDRAEVVVADGEVGDQLRRGGQLVAGVVAEGIVVVVTLAKPVAGTVVVLHPTHQLTDWTGCGFNDPV